MLDALGAQAFMTGTDRALFEALPAGGFVLRCQRWQGGASGLNWNSTAPCPSPLSSFFVSVYAIAVQRPPRRGRCCGPHIGRGMNGALPFVMGFVVGDLVWFIAAAAGLSVLAKTYAPLFVR